MQATDYRPQTPQTTVRTTTGATVLHVTHSGTEAQALGDQMFVLEQGKITERNDATREGKE